MEFDKILNAIIKCTKITKDRMKCTYIGYITIVYACMYVCMHA